MDAAPTPTTTTTTTTTTSRAADHVDVDVVDRPLLPDPLPDDRPWWKVPPVDRRGVGLLFIAYLAMAAVLIPIGFVVVEFWDGSAAGDADASLNRWFEDRRTEQWDRFAELGSMLSDTSTKVLACAALLPVCLWLFRRWHDWFFLVAVLVVEATTFATVSLLVGRDRPPVEQLDDAPTASFPSGHIAAAVVFYVGLAVVLWSHTRNAAVRTAAVVVAVLAPVTVVLSRVYMGMHYPTDAVAGVVLGLATLALVRLVVAGAARRTATGLRGARAP